MAKVIHLRCLHCAEPLNNSTWPYCATCNLALCYKAMPILLGMLLTAQGCPTAPAKAKDFARDGYSRWRRYPHLKYIMD